jgi:hypothetical protein
LSEHSKRVAQILLEMPFVPAGDSWPEECEGGKT